jgi:N-alpha-acetyltransferase 15/16, NatA auxiliary subunit
LRDLGQL